MDATFGLVKVERRHEARIVFDLFVDLGTGQTMLVRDCALVGSDPRQGWVFGPSRYTDGALREAVTLPQQWRPIIRELVVSELERAMEPAQ